MAFTFGTLLQLDRSEGADSPRSNEGEPLDPLERWVLIADLPVMRSATSGVQPAPWEGGVSIMGLPVRWSCPGLSDGVLRPEMRMHGGESPGSPHAWLLGKAMLPDMLTLRACVRLLCRSSIFSQRSLARARASSEA